MKKLKRMFMWPLMLSKRLYKKKTFIFILVLIPLLVVLFSTMAGEDSGVVTIVLAREDPEDPISSQIVQELTHQSPVIRYIEAATPERAVELVRTGQADGAWIFPDELQKHIDDFAAGKSSADGVIRVVEREGNVVLNLTHERLSGIIFEYCARSLYLSELREQAPEMEALSDQELLKYYEQAGPPEKLFSFVDIDGADVANTTSYLTSPLRGILAVVAVLCCIVTGMYYQEDLERGNFAWLPEKHRGMAEIGYQMVSAVNILAAVLLALVLSGSSAAWWKEALLFLLYSLCCALFGGCMRVLFGGKRLLGALIPVLSVIMLVICPVFFDFFVARQLQFIFPPTYYIVGVYHNRYILYLALYDLVLLGIFAGGTLVQRKILRKA